jgi:signal transduction histidine kinase
MLVLIENAQRGFALTGDEAFIKPYYGGLNKLRTSVNDLDSLTRDNQIQQDRIRELRPLIETQITFTNEVIAARKESFDLALAEVKSTAGVDTMSKIQQSLNDVSEEERGLMLSRSLAVQTGFFRFVMAFVGLIFCTLIVLLWLVWMINSNMRSRTIAEEKLKEAELETKAINAELESFSYSVSHDLRAPLRSINGYSQILIEDFAPTLGDEGKRILGLVTSNAKKMGQLIDDLLEFSRLGRQEIRRSSVDVHEQVELIVEELMEREKDRKIDLKIHPLGKAPMDASMMRQVWINLIGNSLKYSRNKEVSIIEIGRIDGKNEMTYYVKDNGAGFDMAYMDKLFGVFQRLHKATEFEGTGVGLALVKRIIDRHNGTIRAEAKVDEGAAFYFTLPAA